MSLYTSYGPRSYPTGRWPDELNTGDSSHYLLSAGTSVQIDALAHIHVIDYDLSPASGPYTFVLTLPIIAHLPNGTRIYFFYVDQCQVNDVLQFNVVAGSGDIVNGDLVSSSFTLNGTKTLFVCIAFNSSYLIHQFGGNSTPAPYSTIPTVKAVYNNAISPLYSSTAFTMDASSYTAKAMYAGQNAVTSMTTVINGMSGYIVPNSLIPVIGAYGFQCTVDGYYLLHLNLGADLSFVAGASGTNYGGLQACLTEFDATGVQNPVFPMIDMCAKPFKAVANPGTSVATWNFETGRIVQLFAGKYYLPFFMWDNSSTTTVSAGHIGGQFYFSYWAPLTPPPAPAFLSLNEPSLATPAPAPLTLSRLAKTPQSSRVSTQKKLKAAAASSSSISSSSLSSGGPSSQMSLADVESVVRQVLRAQQQQQQPQSIPMDIPLVFSAPQGEPSRKRARNSSSSKADGKGEEEL